MSPPPALKGVRVDTDAHVRDLWRRSFPGVGSAGPVDPEIEEALDAAEEIRADCQDAGDLQGEACAVLSIASIRFRQKAFDKAMAAAREAEGLFGQVGDRTGQSWSIRFVAEVWDAIASHERAIHYAERARQQMQRLGDAPGEARMLMLVCQNRIRLLTKRGAGARGGSEQWSEQESTTKAGRASEELLEFCRALGDEVALGIALCMAAQISYLKGELEEAVAHVDEAATLFTNVGDSHNKASALLLGARAQYLMGNLRLSLTAAQEALQLFRATEDPEMEKAALGLLGLLREFDFRMDAAGGAGPPPPLLPLVEQSAMLTVQVGVLSWAPNHGGRGAAVAAVE